MKRLFLPLIIVFLLTSCRIKTGKEVVYPASFQAGISSVRHEIETKNYQNALKQLKILRKEFPGKETSNQIMYYTSLIEYKEGNYSKSQAILDSVKIFKGVKDEYNLIKGDNMYHLKKWKESFKAFYELSGGKYYKSTAYEKMDEILKRAENEDFIGIVGRYKWGRVLRDKEYYIIIRRLHQLNRAKLKDTYIKLLIKNYPDSKYIGLIENYREAKVENKTNIIMVLPLSNVSTTIGQDFLSGFKLATDYAALDVKIVDSRGDPIDMVSNLNPVVNNNSQKLVIGPLFTYNSIVGAVYCNDRNIPIILPMSSDPRIPKIGNNIYQFRKASKEESSILVKYLKKKGLLRAALLYMNNADGRQEEKTFEDIYESNGGKIIRKEFFSPDENDYSTQMESLKVAYDSIGYDVIFVSGNPDNLIMAATQLKYYEINAKIVGLGEWNEDKVIRLGGTYVDSVIYAKADWGEEKTLKRNMAIEFRRKFHYSPSFASYYGYDTGLLINRIFRQKGNIEQILKNLKGFWGTTGYVTINSSSEAPEVELYMILNNSRLKIKKEL